MTMNYETIRRRRAEVEELTITINNMVEAFQHEGMGGDELDYWKCIKFDLYNLLRVYAEYEEMRRP